MNWFASRLRRLWHWAGKSPKRITIPVTVVILVAVSFGGYQFISFYSYIEEDPNFCRSCHIMEQPWDRWATSEHKDTGCHSCHQQSLFASAKLLLDFTFGEFERVERHAIVPDDACEKCHESDNPAWLQVAATAGHQVHAEEQNIACTKCHSVTLHRFEAPGPICSICHEEKHTQINGMAEMPCSACHQYLVNEEEELLPHRKGCLNCHLALTEKEVTWSADAPMQYPCGDCHKLHEESELMVDCLSCHTIEGMHLKGEHRASQCQDCHQPHEWQVTRRETCLTCHPGKADHNSGILCGSCHLFYKDQQRGS